MRNHSIARARPSGVFSSWLQLGTLQLMEKTCGRSAITDFDSPPFALALATASSLLNEKIITAIVPTTITVTNDLNSCIIIRFIVKYYTKSPCGLYSVGQHR